MAAIRSGPVGLLVNRRPASPDSLHRPTLQPAQRQQSKVVIQLSWTMKEFYLLDQSGREKIERDWRRELRNSLFGERSSEHMVGGATTFSLMLFGLTEEAGPETHPEDHRFLLVEDGKSNVRMADIGDVEIAFREREFNIIHHNSLTGTGP